MSQNQLEKVCCDGENIANIRVLVKKPVVHKEVIKKHVSGI